MPNREEAYAFLDELRLLPPANAPEQVKGRIVLYGAGNLGKLAFGCLKHIGIRPEYVLDRNAQPGLTLEGDLPVHTPLAVVAEEDITVLVTTVNTAFTPIHNQLASLGFKNIMPFYDYAQLFKDKHPINNGWFSGVLNAEDIAGIRLTLEELDDPWSRAAYLQMLAWRMVRDDWIFEDADVSPDDRYFIEPVVRALTEEEHFVDVGAYDGRVFLKFLGIVNGKYASAYLIEPDSYNIKMLDSALSGLPSEVLPKVNVEQVALSANGGLLPFSHGFDMASRLVDIQAIKTRAVKLDDMPIQPSFVKMHIEGGEYDALVGGLKMLANYRPILATTIYHNRDGLWKIPQLLMQALDNYKFYFRLHGWCGTGAVLYGLPNERILSNHTYL